MDIKDIVDKFGGQTALASLIGIRQSGIAYWVKRGSIPSKWHSQILSLAKDRDIYLRASDLIQTEAAIVETQENNVVDTDITVSDVLPPLQESPTQTQVSSQFLFYASDDGAIKVQVVLGNETVWASQKGIAEIFNVDVSTINYHLKEIFSSGELDQNATVGNFPIVQMEGGRSVERRIEFYNLDVIISVGYRVNSYQATQFRKWATGILKEYLIKGFALDDDRLKQGNHLFGKDYFNELLERIREIRASERRFYQKITDIYAQCSIDYDKNAPTTINFYAHVQDKLHYAIHGHTSAELIKLRADSTKPHMGLTSWKNGKKGGKITKLDITTGKNYLNQQEIDDLNRLVTMYLDFAENFARRRMPMRMEDWAEKLDGFLKFNAYEVLENFGSVKTESARKHAASEYEKFRIIQDQEFKSDFDKVVDAIKIKKRLPKPENN
ncbi:RhuM family protein [Nitrosospira sp. Nsp1]|uniref:RhuM family protein n=1 Tax=Nitrosospira sp. Nsp1 TaxID=136547 RepID=UPI00088BAB43|nr:RhuM family protein [Nitrosospira sp. Nsp1]SCX62376.1 Uncharacterized conserved protein [Nitrosospira sp. Nsp1]